jgi:hypothetical protein
MIEDVAELAPLAGVVATRDACISRTGPNTDRCGQTRAITRRKTLEWKIVWRR